MHTFFLQSTILPRAGEPTLSQSHLFKLACSCSSCMVEYMQSILVLAIDSTNSSSSSPVLASSINMALAPPCPPPCLDRPNQLIFSEISVDFPFDVYSEVSLVGFPSTLLGYYQILAALLTLNFLQTSIVHSDLDEFVFALYLAPIYFIDACRILTLCYYGILPVALAR